MTGLGRRLEEVPVDDDQAAEVSALVVAALDGDSGAWKDIVERYGPLVMSAVARLRLSGPDAEDVAQVVWLRLVEHLAELREPRALPKWLITTTRNEGIRLLRARRRSEPANNFDELPLRQDGTEPDQDLLRAERRQAILEAFGELSDRQRALMLLLVADPPVPYAEISQRLGIPVGSIGPTRARLVRKLRSSPALAGLLETEPVTFRRGGGEHDVKAMAGR